MLRRTVFEITIELETRKKAYRSEIENQVGDNQKRDLRGLIEVKKISSQEENFSISKQCQL